MNRRQKKKAYKKKYGHNPPKTEVKYYGKEWGRIVAREEWGRIVARAMDGKAEAIRATIPVIRKALEDMARLTRETVESTKALARQIRRNGQNGLHTGNARENRESDEAGSTTPGTEDNTGLHGSRADNAAGNKYGN